MNTNRTPLTAECLAEMLAAARRHPPGALLTASRCIPDGEIRQGCVVSNGATVQAAVRVAFDATHHHVPALVAEVQRLSDTLDQTRAQLHDEARRLMLRPAYPPPAADTAWWLRRLAECPVCSGPSRQTTALVCQACGKDWEVKEETDA